MCDSEYDEKGLPIGAYDDIAENIANHKLAQSVAEGNAVWEKVAKKTSENEPLIICPEYVTPEHAAWMEAMDEKILK